jgi:hypothetical protein
MIPAAAAPREEEDTLAAAMLPARLSISEDLEK